MAGESDSESSRSEAAGTGQDVSGVWAWLKQLPGWVQLAAAGVIGLAAVLTAVELLIDRGKDLVTDDGRARVEVRQVIVANGPIDSKLVDGVFLQTEASTPQLDVTLRNTGDAPVLLTAARVEIVDSARLTVCEFHTGDLVASSQEYAIELPVLPLPSERVASRFLHQEVGAGDVDRFKLLFRLPFNDQDRYVYALRVALVTEGGEAIPLGRFVLGVPETVNRGGRILPDGLEPFGALDPWERLAGTWCGRRNIAHLKRVLGRPGKRSASMAALADFRPGDWWPSFVDRRPARAAVAALLAENGDPALAVFAAERNGDPALVQETRSRAAQLLLGQAADSLELSYPYTAWAAAKAARGAYLFSPSPQAEETIARAESRRESAEAETDAAAGAPVGSE